MRIKDYKCKCGNNEFIITGVGRRLGIVCMKCGKLLKWANKEERILFSSFLQEIFNK